MDIKNITKQQKFALAMDAYKGVSTHKDYTAEERREGMRNLLMELSKDFRKNKIEIFEIIEKVAADELPKRINESLGKFVEVETFATGQTVEFNVKNGKIKAVTVALGSTTKRQRVDNRKVKVETEAIQAKVYEHSKRINAGLVDFVELMNDVMDAIEDAIYEKVHAALVGAYTTMPAANKHTAATMVEADLTRIINTVRAYGNPVIFATYAGAATIPFDESDASKDDKRNKGYVGRYKGCDVVVIENSFEDDDNAVASLDDSYIFVIPAGKEKLVKLGIEGSPEIRDENGKDWTQNFEAKVEAGVAVLTNNHFGIYNHSGI